MNNQPPQTTGSGLGGPEALLLATAAVIVGPFLIAASALLAALAADGRRVWLWVLSMPSLAAALLLWPFTHRHLTAVKLALHHDHTHRNPSQLLITVWPHLWPAWLACASLAPLVALALSYRRQTSLPDLPRADRKHTPSASPRLERRTAQRATTDRDRTGDTRGLFLGYKLGGDDLLPTRHGRAALPLDRLSHHLLVTGATGSGKTETVLRLAYSLAATSDWKIVYLDGKGDPQTMERFAALMTHARRDVTLFPQRAYDGWRGTPADIAGRLLQLIDYAQEGPAAYYRDLAVSAIHLACHTPTGPPHNTNELLRRLNAPALRELHHGHPAAGHAASLRPTELDAIRARYAAFFQTVGPVLDGTVAFEQLDTSYFLLDGLRLKYEAGFLARFLVEEFTQWAVGRKSRQQRVLLIVDEFSAIASAGHGLVDVVERARSFGVAAALCPQVAEGMGSEEAAARIIGSTKTILLHQTAIPSQLVDVAGTRRVYEYGHQLDQQAPTGLGTARLQHQYRADLDEVRRLKVGQCFAISPGHAMKLQIAPAPTLRALDHPTSATASRG